ncbi:MAG TPA: peptidyl-prolyl cis-trans isomerase [Candidatus Acidoferrales bacterium]|nr:peptidyl-prolyl cis-trans isomerase [Candidatus Acidoferrales bacterium]
MLKNLSQSKTAVRIFLGGILVLISGAMVLTMAPISPLGNSSTGSPDAVVTVGGENITAAAVRQQFDQQTRGQTVPPVLQGLYMRQILDQMVFKRLLDMEADRLGMQVTPEETSQRIKQLIPTAFVGGNWIGAERYAQEVQLRTGMSVPQFEDLVRSGVLMEKFKNLVTDGISVTPQEIEQRYRWQNEKVQLDYVAIKPSDLESTINPSDAELSAYFSKNQSKYQVPERRSAKYALLDLDQLKKNTKISDADIESYYQQHLNDYKVENRVHIEQIVFNTLGKTDAEVSLIKQQAQKIDDQAKHAANFEDLAKKYSEDANTKAKGGDIGWIVAGQTAPAFEKAAFSLPKGSVSDLVQTPYSFDIIKVVDREDAHTKPLAEVRDSIVTTLTQEKVNDDQNGLADKMAAAVRQSNRQPIDAIARQFNLQTGETPLVSVTEPVGDLGNSPQLQEALFSLRQGELSQPISIDRGYIIISVDKIAAGHQGTLAEVRGRVLADFRKEKAQDLAEQKAQDLAKRIKTGDSLDKAAKSTGLTAKSTDPITRTSQIPDLGSAKELGAAFNMNPGQASAPVLVSGSWVVYQVKSKQGINPADFAKATEDLKQQILQEKQSVAFEAFHDALQKRYEQEGKLAFNQANLKSLTNQSSS